jgi:hypothetical protein
MGKFEVPGERCCLRRAGNDARTLEQRAGSSATATGQRTTGAYKLLHDHCDQTLGRRAGCFPHRRAIPQISPIALALRWPAVAVDISTKGHTGDQVVARELREKYGLPTLTKHIAGTPRVGNAFKANDLAWNLPGLHVG